MEDRTRGGKNKYNKMRIAHANVIKLSFNFDEK